MWEEVQREKVRLWVRIGEEKATGRGGVVGGGWGGAEVAGLSLVSLLMICPNLSPH